LSLRYTPSIKIDNINDIQKIFKKILDSNQKKEISKGLTLFGPHRDDYEIFLNDSNLKAFGSQGQQRTSVLSLKLSEIDIVKEETGEFPVLLLDDVMSELDNNRQEYLLNNLDGIQTFITCTDKSFFKENANIESYFYEVSKGEAFKN
jgi:DNA replication and repair protein RecF